MGQGDPRSEFSVLRQPKLNRRRGQTAPLERRRRDVNPGTLPGSKRPFRQCGKSGLCCSDVLPHLYARVDRLAVIKPLYADSFAHGSATIQMNSERMLKGWPSIASRAHQGTLPHRPRLSGRVSAHPDGPARGHHRRRDCLPYLRRIPRPPPHLLALAADGLFTEGRACPHDARGQPRAAGGTPPCAGHRLPGQGRAAAARTGEPAALRETFRAQPYVSQRVPPGKREEMEKPPCRRTTPAAECGSSSSWR
ncbi:MAG: DUF1501 domain-containing protein [Verrucomicrobia bacterium]|nr:DUF1501 domain-containing protein [Verrucomicrobiota bacterium]